MSIIDTRAAPYEIKGGANAHPDFHSNTRVRPSGKITPLGNIKSVFDLIDLQYELQSLQA